MSEHEPRKTILINPDFLKFPMRGGRTKKNRDKANNPPKPIKIRTEKTSAMDKTYKRRALNYIRKHQDEKYKQLLRGGGIVDTTGQGQGGDGDGGGKSYADTFKNDFDDSLSFLQKLTDQNSQKLQLNSTLKQYPPHLPNLNSTLFSTPVLDEILDQNISVARMSDGGQGFAEQKNVETPSIMPLPPLNKQIIPPTYGCLKGGSLPTYRTLKSRNKLPDALEAISMPNSSSSSSSSSPVNNTQQFAGQLRDHSASPKMTPEQQRSELKQFLEHRKEEKHRVERVKRQRGILKPNKKQKRTTTRTFRVGKSKHYPRIGVLIPNKTIRTQVLAKKQKIRETPLEDVRRYLIKKGLIRVGSSCPNDVLRQMHESSMMMCGEIQNHNPDNLLYNYLHNGL